jgi:hypothetical protein
MRGLKRKRRTFTRSLSPRAPSGGNQKVSGFDFAASREENALRPTDNAQQTIRAAIAPAQAWSPLAKVKRDRRNLYTAAEVSQSTISLLQSKCKHNQERINNLKRFNNQLLVDLLRERRASNLVIDDAMAEARRLSGEALEAMLKARDMQDKADKCVITERNRASTTLALELTHHSRESQRLRRKHATSIAKLHQEQASLVKVLQSKSDAKCNKLREDVAHLSKKLKEQRLIWQTRLHAFDLSSKNHLSKERARRRNMVQQQLDKSSSNERQLMEIIDGLEDMNSELVDEVKCAKKAKSGAIKLYGKSKEDATRRLELLRQEKEQKKLLRDELTGVLRAQQAQDAQLTEYKRMIETFQSSKRNLKCEVKTGRRGGARWPLWVTEVCCELLVNGSSPSSIPSSILTLFVALYGEEPDKIPSLNYVRQCRVLVQVICETITAMKLAACPNWAEIFFDATTRRQVPFSAVVISLTGDSPETIDPVIVSSCVVLEDETSETQVDGIVTKVRAITQIQ